MGGAIPPWLFQRMVDLCLPMMEALLIEHGHQQVLSRLANPFWFQSFGAVIGMDWNSSGVTTAVLAALKKAINPHAKEIGIYVCGGKGKQSMLTPQELRTIGEQTGLDGLELARNSKLTAKVDNSAVQDGHQLYIHSFLLSNTGDWTVIQQGMNPNSGTARRYHWHSEGITSFVEEPHTGICGEQHIGDILNLVDKDAKRNQEGILAMTKEKPVSILNEIPKMKLPSYCDVRAGDVNLTRLGSILWLAQEQGTQTFDELLLLKGLGPRTLQSLALVSEVLYGAPGRFSDPARFSFAHGGKSGSPFPVPTAVYDETIETLKTAVQQAKIQHSDKLKAIESLHKRALKAEDGFTPTQNLDELKEKERRDSWKYGGRSAKGWAEKPQNNQLGLFE